MIIRATRKLLNVSRIDPLRDERPLPEQPPGEWYAHGVSQSRRSVVHYLHIPSMVSVIVKGRSIGTTVAEVPERLERLLNRHHFGGLLGQYALNLPPVVLATSSRRMLGHLNQMRYHVEYHLALPEEGETVNLDHVEDTCYNYLFSAPNPIKPGRRYVKPQDILATW
jgi:hypothetical protein